MHRFGREVTRTIIEARSLGVKVSVFDDAGCLLWFCESWEKAVGGMVAEWSEALGHGWLEFVHPDDLKAVLKWCDCKRNATVKFRTTAGRDMEKWQWVVLSKKRVGLYWVAVGDRREITVDEPLHPGPNTEFISLLIFGATLFDNIPLGKKAA